MVRYGYKMNCLFLLSVSFNMGNLNAVPQRDNLMVLFMNIHFSSCVSLLKIITNEKLEFLLITVMGRPFLCISYDMPSM